MKPDLIIRIGQKPVSKNLSKAIQFWEKNNTNRISILSSSAHTFPRFLLLPRFSLGPSLSSYSFAAIFSLLDAAPPYARLASYLLAHPRSSPVSLCTSVLFHGASRTSTFTAGWPLLLQRGSRPRPSSLSSSSFMFSCVFDMCISFCARAICQPWLGACLS